MTKFVAYFFVVTANIVYLCRNKKACDYENRR